MKLAILVIFLAVFSHGKDEKCNSVSIKVNASSQVYADRAKDEAVRIYNGAVKLDSPADKASKIQEALIKYREAYKIVSDDLSQIASAVIKNQCADTRMLLGTPSPAPK